MYEKHVFLQEITDLPQNTKIVLADIGLPMKPITPIIPNIPMNQNIIWFPIIQFIPTIPITPLFLKCTGHSDQADPSNAPGGLVE